ncbi:MAG: NAD(+)/NADH kinase [Planctomycetes bacterium]|nr:NAD(+)/NADH kinase [Planctomycetota bacterium]
MAEHGLRLAVTIRDESDRVIAARDSLADFLSRESGVRVSQFGTPDQIRIGRRQIDLVLVLGGDGTILRTCRQLGSRQLPIMGINLGRLGFLADLSPDEFQRRFHEIRARKFAVVPHLMYSCRLLRADGTHESHLGLNEVAVLSGAALRILQVHLAIDGRDVTTYSCDGLIVSTPVGSTAHSLAAGGPLLRQDLQAFVITPISPHTLTNRPLVDRADSVYSLTLPDVPAGATLVIDGQIKLPLRPGDEIEVRKAPVNFQFARLADHSYYATLHRKLGWGGQPANGKWNDDDR